MWRLLTNRKLPSLLSRAFCSTPESIDWRKMGALTAVKNQGDADTCYAYATSTCTEALHYLSGHELVRLSEQQLIDNTPKTLCGDTNCLHALTYIEKYGQCTFEDYRRRTENCNLDKMKTASIDGWLLLEENDEEALRAVLTKQPAIASVYVDPRFHEYTEGVFEYPLVDTRFNKSTGLIEHFTNHAMVVTGYGVTASGRKTYTTQSSWSEAWGIDGCMQIPRDVTSPYNLAFRVCVPFKVGVTPMVRGAYRPLIDLECDCEICNPYLYVGAEADE